MTYTAAVAGATGYAGGEILRLLAGHPEIEVRTVTGASSAGARLGDLAPHLRSAADLVVQETSPENLAGHDVVFLALPHGTGAPLAAALDEETVVVDVAADHRLADPQAWDRFYGTPHPGTWPYGLPELLVGPSVGGDAPRQRELLVGARRIAVPGCYPTGAQLALAPGFAAGLLEPSDVVVVSASGLSGAGKSAKTHLLGAETIGGASTYGVGGVHRHIPEIEQGLSAVAGEAVSVGFTPVLVPMARGILTTATARVRAGTTREDLREAYRAAYRDEQFVRVLREGAWPATKAVQGSNCVDLQLALDQRTGRVVVCTAIDNLVKGTAGAAVQSLNIALGLPESLGLATEGLAP